MIFIEQDKKHAQAAIEFHTQADISEIRLVAAQVKCSAASQDVTFPLESSIRFRPEGHVVKDRRVTIGARFRFDVRTGGQGPKKQVMAVECKFETDYELRKGYAPSDTQISAFKDANAIFNSWPYFREFLNNTVTRMGYPAPTLPFLRIVPKLGRITSEKPKLIPPPRKKQRRAVTKSSPQNT